jgi:phospholipid-binding lipoprotein MlaA
MPSLPRLVFLNRLLPLAAVALLAGCAIAPPRTDDPLEKFNRKSYAFNNALDTHVLRPVAVGYTKITPKPVQTGLSNFFTNIKLPISIANNVLQGRPSYAMDDTGRLLINLTVGLAGFFDPATKMNIPLKETDFGITLARWGVPEGDFLMVPLLGPSTFRDVWQYPVDGYLFDPLSYFERNHNFKDGQYYIPEVVYFIQMRAQLLDADSFLKSAYDPYAFIRDAWRQTRLNKLYDGNPPADVMLKLQQGSSNNNNNNNNQNFDPAELLKEQQQWEQKQKQQNSSGNPSGNQ